MGGIFGAVMVGALVNLNRPARTIHAGWFQISVANLVVILLMIAVFVIAIAVPFPRGRRP